MTPSKRKNKSIKISAKHPPFIIAEMSGNHNGSLVRALKIVDLAAQCGCDALKLQTYTADTMTIKSRRREFYINNKNSLWKGKYLYDLYKKAHTPWEWHKPILDRCRKHGMIGFSTPFDESAVDFLESLKVPMYKIASFEITHIPLIKKVASTKKPMIISTGMATIKEISEAVKTARKAGCRKIVLLKCSSAYPAHPEDINLLTLKDMQKRFKCSVGLSDHTLGLGVAIASVALGAQVIEKHFTVSRADKGVDSAFSLEPAEMSLLVKESQKAFLALGGVNYSLTAKEKASLHFRRSIYTVKDIAANEKITKDNIKVIRPASGLSPRDYQEVLGGKAKKKIAKGTPLKRAYVKK